MGMSKALMAALVIVGGAGLAHAGDAKRVGEFVGKSNHVTKGEVAVVKTDKGYEIRLAGNFWFDGAPDPRVGFGKDGEFVAATDFEELRSDTGEQVYIVPANLDASTFDSVYIWCRKFSVPLGKAVLN